MIGRETEEENTRTNRPRGQMIKRDREKGKLRERKRETRARIKVEV